MSKESTNLSVDGTLKRLAKIESLNMSQLLEDAIKEKLACKYDFNNGYEKTLIEKEREELKKKLECLDLEELVIKDKEVELKKRKTVFDKALREEREKIKNQIEAHRKPTRRRGKVSHPMDLVETWHEMFSKKNEFALSLQDYKKLIEEVEDKLTSRVAGGSKK